MRRTAFWKDRKKVLQKPGIWQLHFSFAATLSSLYKLGGSPKDARWVALHAPDRRGVLLHSPASGEQTYGCPKIPIIRRARRGLCMVLWLKKQMQHKNGHFQWEMGITSGKILFQTQFFGLHAIVFSILVDQNFPNWTLRTCCRWIALTSALVKASGFVMVCLKIGYPMPSTG